MKTEASMAQIEEKLYAIAGGIMENRDQSVFTARGGKHYMEDWDWFQGVALFGLFRMYEATGNEKVWEYLTDWFDGHIKRGLPEKNVNSMCPLLALTCMQEKRPRAEYAALLREWADYAMHQLPRTLEGGFQHKTIDSDNYMQLWDDTLYMLVLFLAKYALHTGDESMFQETIRQFWVHMKYLTDRRTGLLHHGFNFDDMDDYGRIIWGRGNAWFTCALVEYLEMAPLPEGVRMTLVSALGRQAEALARFQDGEGMWHTLVDEPDSYPESSATAGFAYGLLKASRLGLIDREKYTPAGIRGVSAILERIGKDGILTGVSAGTCLCADRDYYRSIRINAQPYGQALALHLLLEARNWTQN